MTMHLPSEVEQLARLVAIKTGKSPEAVLKEAVEDRARAAGVSAAAVRRPFDETKVRQIIKRVSALPVLDDRSPDDIIGYDEHGVPR